MCLRQLNDLGHLSKFSKMKRKKPKKKLSFQVGPVGCLFARQQKSPLSICHSDRAKTVEITAVSVFLEFLINENHCFGLKVLANAGG